MPTPSIDAISEAIAQEIAGGRHVGIFDRNHYNPQHFTLLADPLALKRYAEAGLRDIVIEVDPHLQKVFGQLHGWGATRAHIREVIGNEMPAYFAGKNPEQRQQYIEQMTDMVYYTGKDRLIPGVEITLHGFDDMSGQSARVETAATRNAMARYNQLRSKAKTQAEKYKADGMWESILKDEMGKERERLFKEERISYNVTDTSPNDDRIAREAAARIGDRPMLMIYGASHLHGLADLDDRVVHYTRRPMTKVALVNDVGNQSHLFNIRIGVVDLPDIIYDGNTGEVRRLKPVMLAEGRGKSAPAAADAKDNGARYSGMRSCLGDIANIMSAGCSISLSSPSNDVKPLPTPPSITPKTPGSER